MVRKPDGGIGNSAGEGTAKGGALRVEVGTVLSGYCSGSDDSQEGGPQDQTFENGAKVLLGSHCIDMKECCSHSSRLADRIGCLDMEDGIDHPYKHPGISYGYCTWHKQIGFTVPRD